MINFILPGEVPSKKNSWHVSARGQVYTAPEIKKWVNDSLWLLKPVLRQCAPITQKCRLEAAFYITHDKDIDNMLGSLLDLLQTSKLLANDRLVVAVEAKKFKTKTQPHVRVRLHVV